MTWKCGSLVRFVRCMDCILLLFGNESGEVFDLSMVVRSIGSLLLIASIAGFAVFLSYVEEEPREYSERSAMEGALESLELRRDICYEPPALLAVEVSAFCRIALSLS